MHRPSLNEAGTLPCLKKLEKYSARTLQILRRNCRRSPSSSGRNQQNTSATAPPTPDAFPVRSCVGNSGASLRMSSGFQASRSALNLAHDGHAEVVPGVGLQPVMQQYGICFAGGNSTAYTSCEVTSRCK